MAKPEDFVIWTTCMYDSLLHLLLLPSSSNNIFSYTYANRMSKAGCSQSIQLNISSFKNYLLAIQ